MTSAQKTRILIGTLAVVVAVLLAYAVFGVHEPAAKPVTAGSQVTPQGGSATSDPVPGAPTLSIEAESPVITQSGGHQARVTSNMELSFKWTIIGGSFEGSDEGSFVTWTAGTGAEAILVCKGTNAEGQTNSVTLRVPVLPPAVITRFEAIPPVVTQGNTAKLFWSVWHATKLGLEPGGQNLSNSPSSSAEVKPEKTSSFTLTATDATGAATSKVVQIKVVPAPELLSLKADPVDGSGTTFVVTAEFKGGKAELKRGGQVIASSETSPLQLRLTDVEAGASLQLTVTNEAGAFVANSLRFSAGK